MTDGEREEGKDRGRERERSHLSSVKREREEREREKSPHSKERKDNHEPQNRTAPNQFNTLKGTIKPQKSKEPLAIIPRLD